MQKETVKFNRRKHKRDPLITFGILRSVNKNNNLNKTLKKKDEFSKLVLKKCHLNLY